MAEPAERERVAAAVGALGCTVHASGANFLLLEQGRRAPTELHAALYADGWQTPCDAQIIERMIDAGPPRKIAGDGDPAIAHHRLGDRRPDAPGGAGDQNGRHDKSPSIAR